MITRRANWKVLAAVALLCGCAGDDGDGTESSETLDSGVATGATGGADDSGGTPSEGGDDDGSSAATDGSAGEDTGESDGAGDSGSTDGDDTGDTTGGGLGEPGPDFREAGPFATETSTASASLPSGCSMNYDRYTPVDADAPPTVILAHGFQGSRATMAVWAEHLAGWGLEVIAPDLCHATIFDADHAANGGDLVALAAQLGVATPAYAGYSAGGLAAVLAAAQDGTTRALLGLDMVDSGGLGMSAAPAIVAPAFDLIGDPSMCNESNNGHAVFNATADPRVLAVVAADHCDFQSPADALCGGLCGGGGAGAIDDATIASTVVGMSTAFLLWRSGLDDTGAQWLAPSGHWYGVLSDAGFVAEP